MFYQPQAALAPLTLDALQSPMSHYDTYVGKAKDIDRFCSSTPWIVAAHETLMPRRTPWIFESTSGYVVLAKGYDQRVGHYLQPLEGAWNFATGLVSHDPDALIDELAEELSTSRVAWNLLLLSGIVPESRYHHALVRTFGRRFRVGMGSSTTRHRASLKDGVDGFLGRRPRKFRANLRRVRRIAAREGVTLEKIHRPPLEDCGALYERILAVEERSWKGLEGVGINEGNMRTFYERMTPALARKGALRVTFARRDGVDLAYILGGVLHQTYRGLQMSYDNDHHRLSLGNLLQIETMEDVAREGVHTYDLGCEIAYKANWSDYETETLTLAVFR